MYACNVQLRLASLLIRNAKLLLAMTTSSEKDSYPMRASDANGDLVVKIGTLRAAVATVAWLMRELLSARDPDTLSDIEGAAPKVPSWLAGSLTDMPIINDNGALATHFDWRDASHSAVAWGMCSKCLADQVQYWFVMPNLGDKGVAIRLWHGSRQKVARVPPSRPPRSMSRRPWRSPSSSWSRARGLMVLPSTRRPSATRARLSTLLVSRSMVMWCVP